jgi:Flp pilus assembly protein TadG
MMKKKRVQIRKGERGSFLMEFALVAPLLVLMLAGTVEVGMALNRSLMASQVVRNANVLVVRGIDLSQSQNQQLLIRTASKLGMNTSGTWNPDPNGNGVIFLTKVLRVGNLECALGINNWDGTQASCPNYGKYVIASRINIGNSTRWQSPLGSPGTTQRSDGTLYDSDIATSSTDVATGFPGIITLDYDKYTYISELFVDISKFQLFATPSEPVIYMRNLS